MCAALLETFVACTWVEQPDKPLHDLLHHRSGGTRGLAHAPGKEGAPPVMVRPTRLVVDRWRGISDSVSLGSSSRDLSLEGWGTISACLSAVA